jgi:hypothetical protein
MLHVMMRRPYNRASLPAWPARPKNYWPGKAIAMSQLYHARFRCRFNKRGRAERHSLTRLFELHYITAAARHAHKYHKYIIKIESDQFESESEQSDQSSASLLKLCMPCDIMLSSIF